VRFVLTAHLRQARTLHRRIKESERIWDEFERIIATQGLPPRTIVVLYVAAMHFRARNGTYRAILAESEDEISDQVAPRT
jgi:hypothetical protein